MNENITLEIHRNYYKLFPFKYSRWNKEKRCNIGTSPSLDKAFSVFEKYMQFITKKDILELYDKENHEYYIPIGADLKFITSLLDKDGVLYEIVDKSDDFIIPRDKGFEISEKYQLRDQNQAESLDFLTTDKLFHTRMLSLSTGTGKTFCAIVAAFKLKMPILIISETLNDQWCQKIIEYTDSTATIENKSIKIIKGSDKFAGMMNNRKASHAVFYITTSSTLSTCIKKFGREFVNNVCKFLGIGIKCFDEFHMHWKQNTLIDMTIQTYLTWYLTATPSRSDENQKRLFVRTVAKIPSYGSKTFYDRVDINLINIEYNTYPNEMEHQQCFTSKGISSVMYWNYIFEKYNRVIYISGILKMIIDNILEKEPDSKILVYLAKLEHIDKFKRHFEHIYDNLKFGNYTTEVERKRKRLEIRKNVIFTTIGSGGVGLDVEGLQCVVSFIPFSSQITATQLIGRLRNIKDKDGNPKELYFYDCSDMGFKIMRKQREKRMVIYTPRSKSIDYLRISEEEALNCLQ